ncbi:hypothetical protein ACFLXH_06450 [Chloroflexota bacterium]
MRLLTRLGIPLIILLAIYFVAGYFLGSLPIASDLLGTNKPKDLGVELSTDSAYQGLANLNHPTTIPELQAIVNNPESFTSVKSSLTNAEASSLIATTEMPIKLVQIRFGDGGKVESSGMIDVNGLEDMMGSIGASNEAINTVMDYVSNVDWMIYYVSGECSIINNRVSLDIEEIELGRISVPDSVREQLDNNMGAVENYVSNALTGQGFNIRELSISEDKVNLDLDRPLGSMGPWLKYVQ